MSLTSVQRTALRKRAHSLKPVVILGNNGLTEAVIKEINRALYDHELIKIRINAADRAERAELSDAICQASEAELVQAIGHTITIYRLRVE